MFSYDNFNVPPTGRLAACSCSMEIVADDVGVYTFIVAVSLTGAVPFTSMRPISVRQLVGFIVISHDPLLCCVTSNSSIKAPFGCAAGVDGVTEM